MTYLDDQKTRMLAGQSNVKGIYGESTKRMIASTFKDSSSYYQVQLTTASTPLSSTPIDVWIVDDSKTIDLKTMSLIPGETLNYGDLVLWNSDYWITTLVDYMGGIYYRGSIQKCYSSIKWLDADTNTTIEAYFTITSLTQRSVGLNDGNIIIMPNERRYIAIQNNVYTLKIFKGQKFILDENRSWRVSSINTLFTGLVHLELEEILLDDAKDNASTRVADNSKPVVPTDPTKLF